MSTNHRPGCPEPGWTTQLAHAISGLIIARCQGCGCVELRKDAR